MKKDTRTIEQTIYIADDGTIFLNEEECALYEQKNEYTELIQQYEHISNVMFFNKNIEGFRCESQEQIDNCCNWYRQNFLNAGHNIIVVGKYFGPDYYFFIPNDNPLDNDKDYGTYIMLPLDVLKKQWDVFLIQCDENIINNIDKLELKEINAKKEITYSLLADFLRSKDIQDKFLQFAQDKVYNNEEISNNEEE